MVICIQPVRPVLLTWLEILGIPNDVSHVNWLINLIVIIRNFICLPVEHYIFHHKEEACSAAQCELKLSRWAHKTWLRFGLVFPSFWPHRHSCQRKWHIPPMMTLMASNNNKVSHCPFLDTNKLQKNWQACLLQRCPSSQKCSQTWFHRYAPEFHPVEAPSSIVIGVIMAILSNMGCHHVMSMWITFDMAISNFFKATRPPPMQPKASICWILAAYAAFHSMFVLPENFLINSWDHQGQRWMIQR